MTVRLSTEFLGALVRVRHPCRGTHLRRMLSESRNARTTLRMHQQRSHGRMLVVAYLYRSTSFSSGPPTT